MLLVLCRQPKLLMHGYPKLTTFKLKEKWFLRRPSHKPNSSCLVMYISPKRLNYLLKGLG